VSDTNRQLTLFPGECATVEAERWSRNPGAGAGAGQSLPHLGQETAHFSSRRVVVNPHLLAARRIAKKMHQIRDRETETRAGLAICAQLKAYLADDSTHSVPPTH
jgi:hypothetical protein